MGSTGEKQSPASATTTSPLESISGELDAAEELEEERGPPFRIMVLGVLGVIICGVVFYCLVCAKDPRRGLKKTPTKRSVEVAAHDEEQWPPRSLVPPLQPEPPPVQPIFYAKRPSLLPTYTL